MSSPSAIRVISPGLLSTIQDLGRTGHTAIGVGRGGAGDSFSLRLGNRLIGNEDGAAAIEMTWTGGTFEFDRDVLSILTGGEADARIDGCAQSRAMTPWTPQTIRAGERLAIGPIQSGARTYLCVTGGIDVPLVLDSRSTHLVGAFGGLEGRSLRPGDVLTLGPLRSRHSTISDWTRLRDFCRSTLARRTLRAVEGAQYDLFGAATIERFWTSSFAVSMRSDRAGLRLDGTIGQSALGGRMVSEGMMPGAVQVPESGEPIILGVDHPTTGGYPVIACVAAVDLPVVGQIRPGEQVRFERVSLAKARELHHEQERALNEIIPPHFVDPRISE